VVDAPGNAVVKLRSRTRVWFGIYRAVRSKYGSDASAGFVAVPPVAVQRGFFGRHFVPDDLPRVQEADAGQAIHRLAGEGYGMIMW
jgi:hypothetical protein